MSQSIREPVIGMRDRFGIETRRRDFVIGVLADMARLHGYERLAVPVLERITSFDERVVGQSPWPEWNPAGVFGVELVDYADRYRTRLGAEAAVLIPEGTVPVARWLAGRLSSDDPAALPVKVFYDLPCYRNEPIDTLTQVKLREFSQFGIEVMGASTIAADVEVLIFIHEALITLGIAAPQIRIRIGDVAVFNALAEASGLLAAQVIAVKEHLDALAECRAGRFPDRAPGLRDGLAGVLEGGGVPSVQQRAWRALAEHDSGAVDDEIWMALRAAVGPETGDRLQALSATAEALTAGGITGVRLDLGVVRSHEYYTDMTFEVDVHSSDCAHVEIAGGGRYDRLVGHFLAEGGPVVVPSTGFAFGVERVIDALAGLGIFDKPVLRSSIATFGDASADMLMIPRSARASGADPDGAVRSYLAAHERALPLREAGTRVDVWVGDSEEDAAAYGRARGIGEMVEC